MVFEPPFTALVTTITHSLAQCSGLGSFMHAAHPLHQSPVGAHVVNSNLSLPCMRCTHSTRALSELTSSTRTCPYPPPPLTHPRISPCNSKHALHDLHLTHARDAGYDPSIQAPGLFATGARMQACTRTRAGTRARDGQGQGGDAHAPRTSTCTVVGTLTLAVASSVAICKYVLLVKPSTCVASLTLTLH
jgi:hypothetical protein